MAKIVVMVGAEAPSSVTGDTTMETTTTRKTTLRASDLSCPSCVAKIEKALQGTPGVTAAKVYFETGRIAVEHDPSRASVDDLVKTVAGIGYTAKASAF